MPGIGFDFLAQTAHKDGSMIDLTRISCAIVIAREIAQAAWPAAERNADPENLSRSTDAVEQWRRSLLVVVRVRPVPQPTEARAESIASSCHPGKRP